MIDELVGRVDAYLDGEVSLDELEVWFYDLAFDVEEHYGVELVDLVHRIEAILAESSSGHWNRATLKQELNSAIDGHRIHPRALRVEVGNKNAWRASSLPLLRFRPAAL